jgi:hypothetical protein
MLHEGPHAFEYFSGIFRRISVTYVHCMIAPTIFDKSEVRRCLRKSLFLFLSVFFTLNALDDPLDFV